MKKILLSALLLGFGVISNAQVIKTNAGTFTKPKGGDLLFELNFSPDLTGSSTGAGIFSLPAFSKDMSLLGVKARKFVSENKAYRLIGNLSISNTGEKDANTSLALGVGYGVENHLKGAERLSSYWGYEGKLGYVSDKSKTTKFGIEANTFTGFDYYIIPNVYLGAEISYGLAITNTNPEGGSATTKFELAPGVTSTFRLGWKF